MIISLADMLNLKDIKTEQCETFVQTTSESIEVKIEIVYSVHTHQRLRPAHKPDVPPLWGQSMNISIHLDREIAYSNAQEDQMYRRIIVFAAHLQFMLFTEGGWLWWAVEGSSTTTKPRGVQIRGPGRVLVGVSV